ncbi:MAG: hypothetical protein J7604_10610 [Sporocytophaga sp.]|uniref:COG3014 family protein n=1 Tax=Sporocytophaga sp. TaxID=2231183 RepID=UPI001B0ACCB6|nr:hypothetical protein [Sporocytophaga sp.]MBO9700650.1 hypothetical protein [Sporocytophaga sp.]
MGRVIICLIFAGLCFSCVSYYQKNIKFNTYFAQGQLKEAEDVLAKDKKGAKGKNKLIYYLNRGVVASMQGNYNGSNDHFEEAYRIADNHHRNLLNEGVSFLTNPKMVEYYGEEFELLMMHYYMALNYLKLGQPEEALVECKRMDIRLNQLSDKYKSDNKYKRDAFIHLLMGIVYDANKDYNNAFIAYRNALEIYQADYQKMFNLNAPEQLKQDLLRTAYLSGFNEELVKFEKDLGIKYQPSAGKDEGDLVFIWHDGLGPVKEEWSINFSIVRGEGGIVTFVNPELGLNFPFVINNEDYQSSGLSKLEFIRVAFPKYVERPLVYESAVLSGGGKEVPLQLAEDINAIAFKSLKDRMLLELGKSLLRLGLKKAAEYKIRQQNGDLGAAFSIVNAISEQADTRNWQTLPHSIYYARLKLPEGKQTIIFSPKGRQTENKQEIYVEIKKNNTNFQTFSSLEAIPAPLYY